MKPLEIARQQQASAERELNELREDADTLRGLLDTHRSTLTAAEAAWRVERQPAQLDALAQAKARVEAVQCRPSAGPCSLCTKISACDCVALRPFDLKWQGRERCRTSRKSEAKAFGAAHSFEDISE